MLTRRAVLAAAVAVMVGVVGLGAQGGRRGKAGRAAAWVALGTRSVTDRADHDTIAVTAKRGDFTAIRIDVAGHAVDFQRVVVHFANGADQKLELRETIRAGGSSREIDLEGKDRVIRSIDFWYDAKTFGRGGKATVRVFGRP